MEAENGKLLLFTFSWPSQMDPYSIDVFASNREEAESLIKDNIEGRSLSGKYSPYVYVSRVEKGIRKSKQISRRTGN